MSNTSSRILFVDLARASAVLFMIQGHALHVMLSPEYQGTLAFNVWLYLRGLTSCAFLMLAGFSFSVATVRHWADYRPTAIRTRRRLARIFTFLLLGYAMHLPTRPVSALWRVTQDQWQAFAVVDILQLVGVTLLSLQVLTWLARTPRRLGIAALGVAVAVVLMTPIIWLVNWKIVLPIFAASYLSVATGSLFPVFPWAAYVLFGSALGIWFTELQRRRASYDMTRTLLVAGAAMFTVGVLLHQVPLAPYGDIDFWTSSPNLFLVKAGSVLVLLAGAARLTRPRTALPHVVTVLSRESLTIYLVHVCILYGSIWNTGLQRIIGPTLGIVGAIAWIALLAVSMSLLAWSWHECKHRREFLSAVIRVGATALLAYAVI